jgi:hypothetical protein
VDRTSSRILTAILHLVDSGNPLIPRLVPDPGGYAEPCSAMGIRRSAMSDSTASPIFLKECWRRYGQHYRRTAGDKPRHRRLARNTRPAPEQVARALTWGADEKVLLVLAAAGWVASRGRGEALRRTGNHALLVAVAASLLPNGMMLLFNQTRPTARQWRATSMASFGQARGRFSVGPPLHMGLHWRPRPEGCRPSFAGRSTLSRSEFRDPSPGPLSERPRRRFRARSHP